MVITPPPEQTYRCRRERFPASLLEFYVGLRRGVTVSFDSPFDSMKTSAPAGLIRSASALEIWITPSKGRSSSRIRKSALDTDSATINMVAITVLLAGANRPKLRKITESQRITATSKGVTIEGSFCADSPSAIKRQSKHQTAQLTVETNPVTGLISVHVQHAISAAERQRLVQAIVD